MQYVYDEKNILTKIEFPDAPGFGIQIPANGVVLDQELANKEGFVWVWKEGKPEQVADCRGEYYSTETKQRVNFEELGELPSNLTKLAPTSQYDQWDGNQWVKDTEAEAEALKTQVLAQRDSLLTLASGKIAPLQDAIDLDEATDDEIAKLKAWKKYRVALNRIEQQTGFPNEIEWPEQPNRG